MRVYFAVVSALTSLLCRCVCLDFQLLVELVVKLREEISQMETGLTEKMEAVEVRRRQLLHIPASRSHFDNGRLALTTQCCEERHVWRGRA